MSLFPQPVLPLYSSPVLIFDGLTAALPLPAEHPLPSPALPANWHLLGPSHPSGFAAAGAKLRLMDFFQRRRSGSRVLLYLGDHGSFDVWQIRTLLRGLQDPLTQVLVLGAFSGPLETSAQETLFLAGEDVSPFYLLDTRLVTAVISFCDGLLVQAALHAQVPLLCVSSRRNRLLVQRLVAARAAIQFPEGFWTESTVRDCMRQLMALEGVTVDESMWERARREREATVVESVGGGERRDMGTMSVDDVGWLGTW